MEKNQNKVYIKRQFNCSANELFQWMVRPELLVQWFGPAHLKTGEIQTDLREGGAYQIELIKPDGTNFYIEGVYSKVEEPTLISFSYVYRNLATPPPPSTVTISIEELDNGFAQLSFVQQFELVPKDMSTRTQAWNHMFGILESLLSDAVNY